MSIFGLWWWRQMQFDWSLVMLGEHLASYYARIHDDDQE